METSQSLSQNPRQSSGESPSVSSTVKTMDAPESESNTTHNNVNRSTDALAKSLSTMLSAVITDFDSKAQDTLKSQDHLNSSIDRLTRELDQLLEDAPFPFIMQHAAKISSVRKRVASMNSVLKSIQQRLDNIDRLLSVGKLQEKTTTESSLQR